MSDARASEQPRLAARLGHEFAAAEVLTQALTHRSYCAEHPGAESNERLEFLGDAVVGLAVTEILYRRLPSTAEGELAKLRAAIVNAPTLATVAHAVELGNSLRLGRGESLSGGRAKESILADTLEAVIGAVFVDAGFAAAFTCVTRLFAAQIDLEIARGAGGQDFKTRLQELAARTFDGAPHYEMSESGPDHDKQFTAVVRIGERELGHGVGTSKKRAEQAAAAAAWQVLTTDLPVEST